MNIWWILLAQMWILDVNELFVESLKWQIAKTVELVTLINGVIKLVIGKKNEW